MGRGVSSLRKPRLLPIHIGVRCGRVGLRRTEFTPQLMFDKVLVSSSRLLAAGRFAHPQKSLRVGAESVQVYLELVQPRYYHLDTCFCPLAPGAALYYPRAFDKYGQRALREWIPDLIAVPAEEARRFACNAVVLARTVITGAGCPDLHRQLRDRGFEPVETPLDEFIKAGGSAKCLTLRLDGEGDIEWQEQISPSAPPRLHHTEPQASIWKRAMVKLLSWLPIEWLL